MVSAVTGGTDDTYLRILLNNGGDPNPLDDNGYPAIFAAIGHERMDQTKLLIDRGVEFPPPSPSEVRWAEGRPNQYDIEAREQEQQSED